MKKMGKKGAFNLGDLPQVALSFLLIGVFFAVALVILASLSANSNISSSPAAGLAINNTIEAVSEIPNNWLLLIAVSLMIAATYLYIKIGLSIREKNWNPEMEIRPEGYTKYSQGQRIRVEKIQYPQEARTAKVNNWLKRYAEHTRIFNCMS